MFSFSFLVITRYGEAVAARRAALGPMEDEGPAYGQIAGANAARRDEKRAAYAWPERTAPGADPTAGRDEKRAAGWKIMKNQGLKPHKKKEYRNPRKKKRIMYDRALKRRKGAVRAMRVGKGMREAAEYAGEASGIRSTIVRSRKTGL